MTVTNSFAKRFCFCFSTILYKETTCTRCGLYCLYFTVDIFTNNELLFGDDLVSEDEIQMEKRLVVL